MTDIRDCLAMLREINGTKPKKPPTDDEIKGAFARLRDFQGD